ncbi:MAG TPA: hypothetical protein VN718_00755 [Rhizomicrobium sp.]|nr:hypothetical protein [Rhizomicrobium sp.]
MKLRPHLFLLAALLASLSAGPSFAQDACFSASKTYRIHPLHGGRDKKDSWIVEGDAFAQCVRRAEAADKALHARYPETVYNLLPAATIGCHSPC